MKHLSIVLATALALCLGVSSYAQVPTDNYDVFIPIAKYIRQGDADKLSAWFADNLEVTVFSNTNDSSRNQARQIVRSFFDSYTPSTFNIEHTAGRSNMKYALGHLKAGGAVFEVTIFVSTTGQAYKIQKLKIANSD
jgi:hypothetical protein